MAPSFELGERQGDPSPPHSGGCWANSSSGKNSLAGGEKGRPGRAAWTGGVGASCGPGGCGAGRGEGGRHRGVWDAGSVGVSAAGSKCLEDGSGRGTPLGLGIGLGFGDGIGIGVGLRLRIRIRDRFRGRVGVRAPSPRGPAGVGFRISSLLSGRSTCGRPSGG